MNFGEAIEAVKNGKKAKRKGWNGKNQYIELATNISYVNATGETINVNHENIGNNAIAFVGTSGVQIGWLASQADILADDWMVGEEANKINESAIPDFIKKIIDEVGKENVEIKVIKVEKENE